MRRLLLIALLALVVVSGCGGDDNTPSRLDRDAPQLEDDFSPARPNAEYASELGECIRLYQRNGNNQFTPCSLGRLPLIGQDRQTITTESIMERTLVSHPWMAERFEQVLDAMPADLRRLFGAVTAVAIGAEIRPAYFWRNTGAIYLDPIDLWLTRNEWKTISRDPDYRSGFGQSLNYESLARYVRDGDYAWRGTPASGPSEDRPLEAILAPLAALLFHELAHANDYFPPNQQALIEPQWTPAQAAQELGDQGASAALINTYPLNSRLMMDLAEVRFQGREATETEQDLTPRAVGLAFADDYANDDYAYVTQDQSRRFFREDPAMLFEEAMMQYHFGIRREIAFTDSPDPDGAVCDDYVVRWGERGRAGHQAVRQRLALILPILLDRPAEPYLDELPEAESLTTDLGWCANLGREESAVQVLGSPSSVPLPQQDIGRHGPGHPHPFH